AAYLARIRTVNDRLAAWPTAVRMPERNPRSLVQPAHISAALDRQRPRLAAILERMLIAQEVESRARVGRAWERRLEARNRHLERRVEALTMQTADLRAIVVEAGAAGLRLAAPEPAPAVLTGVRTSTGSEHNPPRPLYEPIKPRSRTPAPARTALPTPVDASAAREAQLVLLADHPDLLDEYGERLGMFDFTDATARRAAGVLLSRGSLHEDMRAALRDLLSPIDCRALDRNIENIEARAEGLDDLLSHQRQKGSPRDLTAEQSSPPHAAP
ncbi:MAG: hypothetical protein ACJ8ED_02560, partial [Xanthobacteraceae bacterium]